LYQVRTTSQPQSSYSIGTTALRVAVGNRSPHTIAENFIIPAAIDMVNIMIGPEEAKKLKTIPISSFIIFELRDP